MSNLAVGRCEAKRVVARRNSMRTARALGMRWGAVLLVGHLLAPFATAQFVTPLPPPFAAQRVSQRLLRVRRQEVARDIFRFLKEKAARSTLSKADTLAALDSAKVSLCGEVVAASDRTACEATVDSFSKVQAFDVQPPQSWETVLPFAFPFMHNSERVTHYLARSQQTTGLSFFSQFAAGVSDKEAFVVTNVLRGLAGRAVASFDYAAVVTKADSADTTRRDAIESDMATVIRLVNNGGTLVGRAYAPMYAVSGQTVSSAMGLNLAAGGIGPIGDAQKLRASGSAVLESMNSVAIRDFLSLETQAELVIGLRAGYVASDAAILQGGSEKGFRFGQVGVGLRQKGSMTLSALVNWVPSPYKGYIPRLVVNFGALKGGS